MLATPRPGTKEHMLLWLAGRDPGERYDWDNARTCACGTYAREALGKSNYYWWAQVALHSDDGGIGQAFDELNRHAADVPRTYGALYERVRADWG
jgi:hypothetical protein